MRRFALFNCPRLLSLIVTSQHKGDTREEGGEDRAGAHLAELCNAGSKWSAVSCLRFAMSQRSKLSPRFSSLSGAPAAGGASSSSANVRSEETEDALPRSSPEPPSLLGAIFSCLGQGEVSYSTTGRLPAAEFGARQESAVRTFLALDAACSAMSFILCLLGFRWRKSEPRASLSMAERCRLCLAALLRSPSPGDSPAAAAAASSAASSAASAWRRRRRCRYSCDQRHPHRGSAPYSDSLRIGRLGF
jgi:hypothetical protein